MATKREIDKEQMYKKIMPSVSQIDKVNDTQKQNNNFNTYENLQEQSKKKVLPNPNVNLPYSQPRLLVNIVEYAVKERLDEAFSKFRCCQCDKCVKDVIAIALNTLPPNYVVIHEQDLLVHIKKYEENVVPALVKAIMIVKNNPRH